jgi:SAM-dependent methyltransferase
MIGEELEWDSAWSPLAIGDRSFSARMKTIWSTKPQVTQCQKPTGWLGRLIARNMNARHSDVTDWGLSHLRLEQDFTILDVGCGGGRTVSKLAAIVTEGNVYGLDYSSASVAVASTKNRDWIKKGRVDIREGSVSQLPFATGIFDLVVAVETHFWWPDLPGNFREVLRVLKPCGTFAIIAEVYRGAESRTARLVEEYLPMTGMKSLSPEEHRQLLTDAGYEDAQVIVDAGKGWIFARGRKSFEPPNADSI